MDSADKPKQQRRERERSRTRASILDAARRVATREGARNLSLRAAAAEAGYAPAALYGYFRNKDELLLALAAEDLSALARAMREVVQGREQGKLGAAAAVALDLLENTETFAAVPSALPQHAGTSDAERVFNGRMIAALTALSEAVGDARSREAQADVLLIAAALTGLALLGRAGRLQALGFTNQEILARLNRHFSEQD